MTQTIPQKSAQVVDLFSGKTISRGYDKRIIRLSPEYDGLGMLYGNDSNPGKLFSMKVMGWGLQANGEVVGLVPWLDTIAPCPDLKDPLNGHWEGYYNITTGHVFYDPPNHKKLELQAALKYYDKDEQKPHQVVQEIPDTIGTHAILADPENKKFIMMEVFSWRLMDDGTMQGMLIDRNKVQETPVLLGDNSLYAAQQDPNFKYFFQYRIANKIKQEDPEAMEAIALLMDFDKAD